MAAAERRPPGTPTVVVDHLDIVYRIVGGGRQGLPKGQGGTSWLRRVTGRAEPAPTVAKEVHAVKDVSFVAHHGESIGIIGRNGSGKSTLLRAVAGLIPPTNGNLWVSGDPSLLGVNAVLMRQLSGERNIYIGGQALGLSKNQVRNRFEDIVEFSGIGDAVYRPMKTYSSGMGARLRFAISTSAAPDVLMIDEALATGDADFRERSAKRIADIRDQAGTVFLVSHSNGSIRRSCDRVLWMDDGRLVMDGPTEEVLEAYEETLPKRTKKRAQAPEGPPAEPDVPGVERVAGGSRADMSAALSARTYPTGVGGAFVVPAQLPAVVRAVLPSAVRLGWPILFTQRGRVPDSTSDELVRLGPGQVVVVGSQDAVQTGVEDHLRSVLECQVSRVDERSTAAICGRLLDELGAPAGVEVRVINDGSGPNNTQFAVTAALEGQALLVVDEAGVDAATLARLQRLAPTRFLLAQAPEKQPAGVVESLGAIAPVEHAPGPGPRVIAAERTESWDPGVDTVYVGPLMSGNEGVIAAAAAAYVRQPLLFSMGHEFPVSAEAELKRLAPRRVVLVGAPDRVSTEVREQLGEHLRAEG